MAYLDYVKWQIHKGQTLDFLKKKQGYYSTVTYRKLVFQIRKFLVYLEIKWAQDISAPSEPMYMPKRVTKKDIVDTIHYVKGYGIRYVALILLGASSGMRPEEMFQLKPKDIDLENRAIHIKHDPRHGQTIKTKRERIAFFNQETKIALSEYIPYYQNHGISEYLFPQHISYETFRHAPIKVKDLRKFFSQEWDRKGGPTSIKKILMGHSLKGDVDLMHYNYQSEEDLKKIYDKVNIRIN